MIHRIGMLLPATNIAVEIEFNRTLPKNYQLFISRVKVSSVDEIGWKEQDADMDYQTELLATIKPEVIIMLQTAGSFYGPPGYDADIVKRIQKISGVPGVTTAHSIGRILKAIGAKKVAMLSPYNSSLATTAKQYYKNIHDIEIETVDFFNLTDVKKIIELGPEPAEKAIEKLAQVVLIKLWNIFQNGKENITVRSYRLIKLQYGLQYKLVTVVRKFREAGKFWS